jgi:hypothetical protein
MDIAIIAERKKLIEFADKRTLLILSILDLTFGIVSMCLIDISWQVCSLIASCLTMCMLVRILVKYKNNLKGNVDTLIISILDILTGALSVALALYILKALSVTLSTLKSTKIVIQTKKALKLVEVGKPVITKTVPKIGAVVATFILSIIKRGKKTMSKNEVKGKKQNTFATYLKNNPKTLIGILSSFIVCACTGAGVSLGMIWSGVAIPLWASIVIGAAIFVIFLVALCLACTSAGLENPVMVTLRKTIKKLGYGNALDVVDKAYANYELQKAEEQARVEAENAAHKQQYENAYKAAVVNGSYFGSLEEYIAEQVAKEEAEKEEIAKAQNLANFRNDVLNGSFTGSFEEYCKLHQ